ncbi:MAG: AraC family transcriptional regulator [Treponema sp.]|nr:AraC family transcriptional regulator [Treponema sp.]
MDKEKLTAFFEGNKELILLDDLDIATYADVLAPDRQRALKNSLICFIAVISRSAIENGLDVEESFSLSDYYINEVEKQQNERQLQRLLQELSQHYAELVRAIASHPNYSSPVVRAIRYILHHIQEPCRVSEVAASVSLNPQYMATLFKNETGLEPSSYIRQRKMKIAIELLTLPSNSIIQIAEALGYCDSSHFIREFKKVYGLSPRRFIKQGNFKQQR